MIMLSRHDRRSGCAAILNHARVIEQEPCQTGKMAEFRGSYSLQTSLETSPQRRGGEVSKSAAESVPASGGRGGARNKADRESHALTADQVANLIAATRHASAIGLPLNRMITIHWERAGIPLAGMAKATGRFLDLMAKAIARRGGRLAWLWVHESVDTKGGHCHMLVHLPAELAPIVPELQKGWLRVITGRPYRARVICGKPIGGRLGLDVSNPALHEANLAHALAYFLKGAHADAARQFELVRLEPGGRVIGKRCGISQNIGPKARLS